MEERLTAQDLDKRVITVESYYDIEVKNDIFFEICFKIKHLNSPVDKGEQPEIYHDDGDYVTYKVDKSKQPKLYYDGSEHAILIKNEDVGVICSYVNPKLRKSLAEESTVRFIEYKDGSVREEYTAKVVHLPYPEVKTLAETIVEPIEKTPGSDWVTGWEDNVDRHYDDRAKPGNVSYFADEADLSGKCPHCNIPLAGGVCLACGYGFGAGREDSEEG